ncbi:hypothetical protein F3N42_04030 [Marinihelvus fidelis]|uniref:Uncharacterized protein n=1 Tax=Marinihelvus fidelis TaxID=2613842 RepID=A0A5N0TEQ2_9GAMM|nr:hypothetical protein [Marinihelvus fidelis]KAA9133525.1 hypothetical protein F3N42_04030 [Marinihelvus fidelis]
MNRSILSGIATGALLFISTSAISETLSEEEFRKAALPGTVADLPGDPEIAEFRVLLQDWASEMQRNFAPGQDLAGKFTTMSDDHVMLFMTALPDRSGFEADLGDIITRLQDQGLSDKSKAPAGGASTMSMSEWPFDPDYPPNSGPYNTTILSAVTPLGGAQTDRCDAGEWGDYFGVWKQARDAYDVADTACTIGGCDPTGVGCAIACGVVEAIRLGVTIAKIPLEACDVHQAAIDGAEIEATFENVKHIHGDVDDLDADVANLDADLAAHDANIDGDLVAHNATLVAHDVHINADLEAHDAHIDADLAAHDAHIDADLAAHDAHIDADLAQHDSDIKGLLGTVQSTLDDKVEFRRVHIQVLELVNKKRYLVRTSEHGTPVSVEFLAIEVFDDKSASFSAIGSATATEIEPGLYDLDIKTQGKVFRLKVKHDDNVDHFGEIIFHHGSVDSNS